jgi:hypothetical protein
MKKYFVNEPDRHSATSLKCEENIKYISRSSKREKITLQNCFPNLGRNVKTVHVSNKQGKDELIRKVLGL